MNDPPFTSATANRENNHKTQFITCTRTHLPHEDVLAVLLPIHYLNPQGPVDVAVAHQCQGDFLRRGRRREECE